MQRGLWERKSSAASSRSRLQWPLIRPRDSPPYAVTPMPSSRTVGRISSSMPREISEYSICRSPIGCTAAARRTVLADASESPMRRT